MIRWLPIAAYLIWAMPAAAQSYLLLPDMVACLAKSAAQCQALGCDKTTTYWWACQPLTDGTAAIEVRPGDPQFDKTTTNAVAKSPVGLSASEQSALQTKAQMGAKLPAADAADAAPAKDTAK